MPGTVSGLIISIFLQSFLLEAVQLSAYWVHQITYKGHCLIDIAMSPQTGTVMLLGHLMSVVANPAVGQLSDSTHTRWGRRRPWIAWWAIPFGIFYACLWLAPAFLVTQVDKFACVPHASQRVAPDFLCAQMVRGFLHALDFVALRHGCALRRAYSRDLLPVRPVFIHRRG